MHRFFKRFIAFAIAIVLVLFFQGKTKNIDITFQEAVESFNQFETVVNDFIEDPDKEKISEVSQYEGEFIKNYYALIDHQTFYNKLFGIEPILTEEELMRLEELYSTSKKLDDHYVSIALNRVFKASNFSALLDEAKKKGGYKSENVDIQTSGGNLFKIVISGTFSAGDTSNISTRYFIIETEHGNYFWKKPSGDYSMSLNDKEISIKAGKTTYEIKSHINHPFKRGN